MLMYPNAHVCTLTAKAHIYYSMRTAKPNVPQASYQATVGQEHGPSNGHLHPHGFTCGLNKGQPPHKEATSPVDLLPW